ncbi:DUF3077 domain-containing protein [Pseudomonas sp. CCM 7893]|uniref:DUF3077 domain-containing protein n=1 Tax=Pseudomonas spelaei TaxID=1055469 RepID=A0A6I3W9J4_9PSED|nr:DUF3077 domain-containing protein [Pseudomonas spelaei]MUF03959.1 DUF3077 domain-containing protein [Pseudomonas spelaei]QLG96280.1 DUF3077 domain-containing protein [Pseudomonas yamanorum]
MVKVTPDPPLGDTPRDRAAVHRTIDRYLTKPHNLPTPEAGYFTPNADLSFEDALARASDLLNCAAATAHESADGLDGPSRALVHSVMHLIEMAKVMVDRSLDCLHPQ